MRTGGCVRIDEGGRHVTHVATSLSADKDVHDHGASALQAAPHLPALSRNHGNVHGAPAHCWLASRRTRSRRWRPQAGRRPMCIHELGDHTGGGPCPWLASIPSILIDFPTRWNISMPSRQPAYTDSKRLASATYCSAGCAAFMCPFLRHRCYSGDIIANR